MFVCVCVCVYKVDKTVAGRRERSILHNKDKCVLHIRSEVKIDTSVNCVLLHFKKSFVFRNITQLRTARFCVCSFFSTGFKSFIYTVTL